ncbi:MAG: putative maturation protein [Pepevirus faecivivens]|uniref:Maturation protein n=1 Tax=Leviviridae sp. TaxID=2027243 RepID=A0ABY3SSK8_9VIRU|nr:MAG: putative maturation protein [Leviviridae sp.]UJQ85637.1 MAG: putative maturation protein [Leviviridae sp.]
MQNVHVRHSTNHNKACEHKVESTHVYNGVGDIKDYSVTTESRAPLVKGDRVHALPYWSQVSEVNRPSVPLTIEWWTGGEDWWPWPPCEKNKKLYTSHRTLSIQSQWFVDPPPLALPAYDAGLFQGLQALADTKALGNARRALANLPMIFAERRETLQMVGKRVANLTKAMHSLQTRSLAEYRKALPKNRRAVARRIANDHLEVVFGWLPAISEIEGLCEFISSDDTGFIRSRGVQAERRENGISRTRVPMLPNGMGDAYAQGRTPCRVFDKGYEAQIYSVRTALRYKLQTQLVGDLYALGFDPVGTAFDMVPLSFISGWISNFDYWVRTLTPAIGLEFETGSRNFRRVKAYGLQTTVVPHESVYSSFGGTKALADGRIQRDDRYVLTKEPEAELRWDVDVGLFEVTAAISIMIQRYLKPLQRVIRVKPFRYRGPRSRNLPPIRYSRV